MNISQFFRSLYTIVIEGYKWDNTLDKAVPTGINKSLEEIDRHQIQHKDDFTMRNTYYKEADYGGYVINVESFDIVGALERPLIMKDGN